MCMEMEYFLYTTKKDGLTEKEAWRSLILRYSLHLKGASNPFSIDSNGYPVKISFRKLQLKKIPELVGKLTHIKKIDFSQNQITKIEGLDNLTQLTELNLSQNQITRIEGLDNLTQLKKLNLGQNQITKIEGLDNLTQLTELNINENQINEIKGLGNLIKLRVLNLSKNPLSFNDTKIYEQGAETVVQYCKLLDSIEKKLFIELIDKFNLKKENFQIDDNTYKLFKIDLSNRNIKKIPKLIGKLSDLRELNLSHNKIIKIEELENLSKLEKLDLSHNQILEIGGLEKLSQLQELSLSNNRIMKIKGLDKLAKLRIIDLSDNYIKKIEGFEKNTQLRTIKIDRNPLEKEDLKLIEKIYKKGRGKAYDYYKQRKIDQEQKRRFQIEKIRKMMKVSDELKMGIMQKALGLDEETFFENIIDWAVEFGFVIENDRIIINKETVSDFINMLDAQFQEWDRLEESKEGKV